MVASRWQKPRRSRSNTHHSFTLLLGLLYLEWMTYLFTSQGWTETGQHVVGDPRLWEALPHSEQELPHVEAVHTWTYIKVEVISILLSQSCKMHRAMPGSQGALTKHWLFLLSSIIDSTCFYIWTEKFPVIFRRKKMLIFHLGMKLEYKSYIFNLIKTLFIRR